MLIKCCLKVNFMYICYRNVNKRFNNLKTKNMKNVILTFVMLFSVAIIAQENNIEPKFEKDGDMIKATYFHDNGEIAQMGNLLNKKPHGEWVSFDAEGKKTGVAQYYKGEKVGKWLMWSGTEVTEVNYQNNKIVNVVKWDESNPMVVN